MWTSADSIFLFYLLEVKNNTQVLIIEQSPYYALIEKEILSSLQPILESWSGQKLSQDHVVYGIRRYLRGASLMAHVDRLPTHIISAILQVRLPLFIHI